MTYGVLCSAEKGSGVAKDTVLYHTALAPRTLGDLLEEPMLEPVVYGRELMLKSELYAFKMLQRIKRALKKVSLKPMAHTMSLCL